LEICKKKVAGLGPETLKKIMPNISGWIAVAPSQQSLARVTTNVDPSTSEVEATKRKKASQLEVASWNIRNISENKTEEKLKKILAIITCFDFLAIQEVRDLEIMEKIKALLGIGWDMAISGQVGSAHHKEHYAFLWRVDRVSVLTAPKVLDDSGDAFVREPFIGYFKAGEFDFVLATIHVVWGDSIVGRREEIKKLDDLLKAIQNRAGAEKDIIVVGDFNMPPTDVSWKLDGLIPLINPPQKTLVGDTSLYDNIWISGAHTMNSEYKGVHGCVEFDKLQYEDTIAGRRAAISEISDHRPVWAQFGTDADDDVAVTINLTALTL